MSDPTVLTSGVWQELLDLAATEGPGRHLLERLLALWAQSHGAEAVALYARRGERLSLLGLAGDDAAGRFPKHLESLPEGVGVVELPEGVLLHRRGEPEAADPLTLLVALAAEGYALESRLERHRFQVKYRGVELEALYDVGLAIASTLDLDQLAEEILLRAVSLLDARRGALFLRHDGALHLQQTFGGRAKPAFRPPAEWLSRGDGSVPAVPEDLLPGARHLLALPIEIETDVRGLLVVADKESRHGVGPFPEEDRRTLSLFANQAAIALENARLHREQLEKQRLEREMELAAEIQRQILPDGSPDVPGFDLLGWSRPARQVGGDYYDLVRLEGGRLRLVLGDVSGKGIPAALLVSTLHSALRLLIGEDELTPEHLEQLNRHVAESSAANKFITLLVAELSIADGTLTYVNAGHNPGLLLRRDGRLEQMDSSGFPVGMLPSAEYSAGRLTLEPGDLLCLYSDGLTEASAPSGEEFGEQRLIEQLRDLDNHPLDEVAEAIGEVVTSFAAGAPQADDETLVLLRRVHNPS